MLQIGTRLGPYEIQAAIGAGGMKDGKPRPFVQTEFNETYASFSPDGRWVAYTSAESRRNEICSAVPRETPITVLTNWMAALGR